MQLEELLTPETICLHVWQPDPIRLVHEAGRLLVECGGVEERYVAAMEQALRRYGPYMVIVPGVALLHARPQDGVRRLCMSLLILDCPVAFGHHDNDPVSLIFAFAPNAVLVGFLMSLLGGIVGLFLMGPLGLALIIPGMVPHFFDGGTSGVFGNSTGGRRGAIIGAFVNGLLITLLPALLLAFMGTLGLANTTFGDTDFCLVGIIAGLGARTGYVGAYIVTIVVLGALVGLASFVTLRLAPPTPALEAEAGAEATAANTRS